MSENELIVDGYELTNLVASGSNSQVWEVNEQGGSGQLAMKLLLPEAATQSDQKQTLKHEFKVGKSLSHPNFVSYHKFVSNKQHTFMVMDLFRAPSLKGQISGDRLSLQERFRKLVESVCIALGYMHDQGWLHRDIKPDNIMFNKSSELKLIDFSLSSRAAGAVGKLLAGKAKAIKGTRTYIAPETLMKKQPTIQTDMYSLGITFYECLTGQAPFTGTSPSDLLRKHVGEKPVPPSDLNPNLTPDVDAFILKMLAKKPSNRHEDMNEIAAEFRSLKLFHEEIGDLRQRQTREAEEKEKANVRDLATRLDSRTDHARSKLAEETGESLPPVNKPKRKPAPKPAETEQPAAPTQPVANHPQGVPPGYAMPGQMPGMPQGQWYPQDPQQIAQMQAQFLAQQQAQIQQAQMQQAQMQQAQMQQAQQQQAQQQQAQQQQAQQQQAQQQQAQQQQAQQQQGNHLLQSQAVHEETVAEERHPTQANARDDMEEMMDLPEIE